MDSRGDGTTHLGAKYSISVESKGSGFTNAFFAFVFIRISPEDGNSVDVSGKKIGFSKNMHVRPLSYPRPQHTILFDQLS